MRLRVVAPFAFMRFMARRRLDCEGALLGSQCRTSLPFSRSLLHRMLPSQNLIEDDSAECCGAYSSRRERAELERKVASAGRERRCDSDQIPWVGEVDAILYPDPACHGGDRASQHDHQAAD